MRLLLTVVALALATVVQAQTYPTKTVRLISGVTPGSASDTMARILAEKLSASLGQPVIVENRLGAGGLVGAKWVATQEPDGHNIMMYASAFTVSTLLNPGLDPKELAPVATVATISGPVDNAGANTVEVIVKLIQNAFFKAIMPGFEREVRALGGRPARAKGP